ncbi:MAG: amidohydrolase family protein [Pseudomonadota bacterium]
MTVRENATVPDMDGVPVIDGQAFVASTDILSPTFVQAIAEHTHQWMAAQGLPVPKARVHAACEAQFNDPYCDALVKQMDEAGIARSVLMLPDFTYALRDARLSIAEMIERHRAIRDRHPGRFHVMFGVDPRWGTDSVDLFERSLDAHGFDGMKLYPPCGVHPADRALWPFYEICRDRGLPVSVHTGGTASVLRLDLSHPRMVEEPSRLFPGVDFIISHASNCYSDEAVMLCTSRPNVYLDISAYAAQPMRRVNALMEYGIGHKIVFATDWPSFRGQGPQAQLVRALSKPGGPKELLRDFEWKRFMGGTMASLLAKRVAAPAAERPTAVEA